VLEIFYYLTKYDVKKEIAVKMSVNGAKHIRETIFIAAKVSSDRL